MIVSILDIVASTKMDPKYREFILNNIDTEIAYIKKLWGGTKIVGPQRIQSDTIELAANCWLIHAQLAHFMLTQGIKIYLGIGAHRIHIWNPNDINKCDGPAFWNARRALENAKKIARKGRISDIIFVHYEEPDTSIIELQNIASIITYTTWIGRLRKPSRKYLYDYIWRMLSIDHLAKKYETTIQNISQIINKHMGHQLRKIVMRTIRKNSNY